MDYITYLGRRMQYLLVGTLLTALIFMTVLLVSFPFSPSAVLAAIGTNATVVTQLQVGNVYPEIESVTILNSSSGINLSPNATVNVTVLVIARDFNGEGDILNVSGRFFDTLASSLFGANDNNNHYENRNCTIDVNYGDAYEVNATCVFPVWYYANNATWNVTVDVNDTYLLTAQQSNITTINTLLAVGLPATIDYGQVNATQVSRQNITNVTNFGNVILNLSLSGYSVTPGDNNSMNCTLGVIKNISINYEKYNLTSSNTSDGLTLTEFESIYGNLTSNPVIKRFNLGQRTDDTTNNAYNATYWRIYVPVGVAGTCAGNIVFGAAQAAGS